MKNSSSHGSGIFIRAIPSPRRRDGGWDGPGEENLSAVDDKLLLGEEVFIALWEKKLSSQSLVIEFCNLVNGQTRNTIKLALLDDIGNCIVRC